MKRYTLLLGLLMVALIMGGCSSQETAGNYQAVAFKGVELEIPDEWTFLSQMSDEIQYKLNFEGKKVGFFYIYSFPYPREVYKSMFIDWKKETYKGIYALSDKTKLQKNMTLMTFKANADDAQSSTMTSNVIQIILVESADQVLEVSFDMPADYYENNSDVLKHIQKSLKWTK
ncbi:hypothetical protein [Paenibacillus sp. GCM10027626]|uniref:hypothetical protein n=1 Tax=Paenibacillus sp. GCM10027626 TaxID=3273411 RepID=UPI00363F54BD